MSTSTLSSLRKSFRMPLKAGRRYNILEGKENVYFNTPKYKRSCSDSDVAKNGVRQVRALDLNKQLFQRGTNLTKSVREAVGSLKQKFRASTRRLKRLNNTATPSPSATSARKSKNTKKGTTNKTKNKRQEVKMYSPFRIETPTKPSGIRTVSSYSNSRRILADRMETPTRLRREVEELTANMQALATLTPNTLQTRARSRRSGVSPLTNGSLCTRPPTGTPGTRSSSRLQAKRMMPFRE